MKKIITSALFIFGIPILFIALHLNAAENKKANNLSTKIVSPTKAKSTGQKFQLQKDQYSLEMNNKITIYNVKDYEGLSLTSNCFKKGKPFCQAYTASFKKVDTHGAKTPTPYHNNLGSTHCSLIGGSGVIVKSSTGGESDFCLFKDGSMVSSWSAYYKTYPQKQ